MKELDLKDTPEELIKAELKDGKEVMVSAAQYYGTKPIITIEAIISNYYTTVANGIEYAFVEDVDNEGAPTGKFTMTSMTNLLQMPTLHLPILKKIMTTLFILNRSLLDEFIEGVKKDYPEACIEEYIEE